MNTLKAHRKARHLKQHVLAALTGVSQSRICSMERYNDLPSPRQARMLADFFGIKVESLFPDGTQSKLCSRWNPDVYMPPEPVRPVVRYPREFYVPCRHCHTPIYMRTDDRHPVSGNALSCWLCGAEFEVREEARV